MADNVQFQSTAPATPASGTVVSSEEVTTLNGSSVTAQQVQRVAAAVVTADGIAKDLPLGRNADASSLSIALSTEDVALLTSLLAAAPTGYATSAKQDTGNTSLASIDGKLPSQGQALAAASLPVVLPAAQITTLTPPAAITGFALEATQTTQSGLYGALTETAPATDTASSGLNGRLQRIAQRLTSLIALLPTSLGQTTKAGSLSVTLASNQDALPITDNSGSLTVDNAGTFAVQATLSATDEGLIGALTETAPATDTASSGLNGRLQRIAQRLTTLLAVFPTTIDVNSGNKSNSTLRVVLATDQPNLTSALNVSAALAASEAHLGELGGNLIMISTEFTRPSDTTAYAANDVVSDSTSATTMQALANAARVSGGSGYITGLRVATDKKSITPRIRVHLFNTTGATLAVDNAAYKDVYADSSKRVGYWDMPAMSTAADTSNSDNSRAIDLTLRIPYTCAATSLYYVLETLDAFTPASGEKFTVTIFATRN